MSAGEALGVVKAQRRVAAPNKGFLEQLGIWEGCGFELWEEGEGGVGRRRTPGYEGLVRRVERERQRKVDGERERRGGRGGRSERWFKPWVGLAGRGRGGGRGGEGGFDEMVRRVGRERERERRGERERQRRGER